MKNKSSLFVSFLSLKGWLTAVNPHPGPAAVSQLCLVISEPHLYRSASQAPHHWEELQKGIIQHPARSLKIVRLKQPK